MRASDVRFGVVAVALPLALAACKHDADPGSCFREHDNACAEYGRAQAAAGKRLCAGLTWTAGEGTCPASARLGACTRDGTSEWLYSGAPNHYTEDGARRACEARGGSFRPGP